VSTSGAEYQKLVSIGRVISAPLAWFPRLLHGSEEERSRIRFIGNGEGFHWPDLDEDVSVEALLARLPSAESAASLKRWLSSREGAGKEKADA
jgi:Protein of unknown function (DUF2442)